MGAVKTCGGCYGKTLEPLLDLGAQPLAEAMGSDELYPLRLMRCLDCSLVQLSYAVDPDELFKPGHPYATGNSAALRRHYGELARSLASSLLTGDVVVDIGANDGTFLRSFSGRTGCPDLKLIAVEPTDQIRKPAVYGNKAPLEIYQEPFTWTLAHQIHAQYGPAKVVTACNVLAHVPDVHNFLDGVEELLGYDGVFVTENHDLFSITDGLQLDTVYHEHLRYYTVATLSRLLEAHGLRVTSSGQIPTHGGSFRVTARRARTDFKVRAEAAAVALHDLLEDLTADGAEVYGVGAATRAVPLIHYAGIANFVVLVCETSGSDKTGTRMPGTQVPVVDEAALVQDQPAYALLFAWHMKDDIIPKLRAAGYKGKFIVPLPVPEVIDA